MPTKLIGYLFLKLIGNGKILIKFLNKIENKSLFGLLK